MFQVILNLHEEIPAPVLTSLRGQRPPLYGGAAQLLFAVNPVTLTHAIADLNAAGGHLDLRYYLRGFKGYLENDVVAPSVLRFPRVNVDFRRTASEQCGVGLACLLIHEAGVPWRNIAQIPSQKNGRATRPDFIASRPPDEPLVFEAKGTSDLGKLRNALAEGKKQANKYPNPAEAKLSIASFVPMDEDDPFSAHTVVIDPPLDRGDMFDFALENLNRLVTLRALIFAGLVRTARAFGARLAGAESGKSASVERDPALILEQELSKLPEMTVGDLRLRGVRRIDTSVVSVFTGVLPETIRSMVSEGKTTRDTQDSLRWDAESRMAISQFSDGTMTLVRTRSNLVAKRLEEIAVHA